ncbi:MAG: hypothetical protein WCD35_11470 [Mycobacteriales bacterium]
MRGRYRVGTVRERFSCGAGPEGWRYTCTNDLRDTLDLTVDDDGRVRRLVAVFDGWTVRGGAVGGEVLWTRGDDGVEHRADAVGFTGTSPAFDVATARLLGLEVGQSRRLALVELTEPVGAARTVQRSWTRVPGPAPDVDRYDVADLATGEGWVVHLSGEVLVSREGARPAVLEELVV